MSSDHPALRVRSAHVRFGGVVAVSEVDLDVQPGEIVGVIGPNGAGKTTLLDAISGFAPMVGGHIELGGRDISGCLPYERARFGLARSFQDARLFPLMTVRETLLGALHPRLSSDMLGEGLGLKPARADERMARRAAEELLDLVDLRPYLDHRVADLSFGTTRAVELAWLAARRPTVMLMDEPASGLQQSEVAELGAVIQRIRRDAAVVLVDHDVPFVSGLAHRLVAMDLGAVVAEGAPEDVLGHEAVLESYLGTSR